MGHVEQGTEHADGHKEGVHHQRSGQPEELADDEFPAAYRARQHGVQRALLNFLRDQPDADKNRDDHAEQRYRRQAQVDDHELLDVDGNLADQDGGAGEQQRKRDQVVEHAVADGLAERVRCDASDPLVHARLPAVFSDRFSFSTKYCSRVVRTGTSEIMCSRSRRNASSARSWLSSESTARTVSPVRWHSAPRALRDAGTVVPCHTISIWPCTLEV